MLNKLFTKFIFFLFFSCLSIYAQNIEKEANSEAGKVAQTKTSDSIPLSQADLRLKKKYGLQIGSDEPRLIYPSFLINFNQYLTFGISYYQSDNNRQINFPTNNDAITSVNYQNSNKIFTLASRVYFFEKIPVYLNLGIARNLVGGNIEATLIRVYPDGYFALYNFNFDRKPSNSTIFGLGFNWIFENGLSLNFEYIKLNYLQKQNQNVQIAGFANFDNESADLISFYIRQKIFFEKIDIYDFDRITNIFSFSFGYAF